MLADYHIHSYLCKHATGEPADYAATAQQKQLTEICFADHAPAPCGYDQKHRMGLDQFSEYTKFVTELRDNNNSAVLYGIEADYYGNCEQFLKKWLPEQNFDLVIGSIHYIKEWGFDNPSERKIWDSSDVTSTWREYFRLVGQLADTGMYDIMAHIDLPKKFGHRPGDKNLKEMVQPALDKISQAGMTIEINTSGLRKPVKEIYPSPLLLELAHEREISICFGSDAHKPDEVGYCFDEALKLVKECGYTHYARFRQREKELIALPR
ncbi:histidinol-phosphatase HisJ family protein [Verrucomicrobiota bacterium]